MYTRRALLAATGAGAVAGLAGCLGGGGAGGAGGSDGGGSGASGAGGETTTVNEDLLEHHPAARGLADEPTLGPDPFEVGNVIVAFEDPSCTTCRRFEQTTVPRIRSELVDTGRAAFVYRNFPVVYQWGKPAVQALEATYARDAVAFWALKGHYFATQGEFTTDNVLDRTRSFLAANTDVDADAVVADADAKAYDEQVQEDITAAEDAAAFATPTSFIFRDGVFQTTATGAKDFVVFDTALQG